MFSNLSRFGPSMPTCNNRQFCTIGVVKSHPEDMKLKPEYLGNEHFKFLNNFGLSKSIISDKKFIDINNSVNRQHSGCRTGLNSGYIVRNTTCTISTPKNSYCDRSIYDLQQDKSKIINIAEKFSNFQINNVNKPEETKTEMVANNKREEVNNVCDNNSPAKICEESKNCNNNNLKVPKKMKQNKGYQKSSSKKLKKQKNFQKQSKRESDRNSCSSMSPQKQRRNKPWHKKSLKMEIMEVDDSYDCSYSDHNLESPVITQFCSTSLPNIEAFCIKNKLNTLSCPIKGNNKTKIKNKLSPVIKITNEDEPTNDIQMDNSPNKNHFRSRLPSECESEDSFIVFEDSSKCFDMELSDCGEDSVEFNSSADEDSSDDEDVVDFCSIPRQANGVIKAVSPFKKVRFAVGKDLCEVHPMVQWSFAYQKARKGPWEQYAVDRMRFRNRVSNVELTLNAVLQPAHRRRIFEERFQHSEN